MTDKTQFKGILGETMEWLQIYSEHKDTSLVFRIKHPNELLWTFAEVDNLHDAIALHSFVGDFILERFNLLKEKYAGAMPPQTAREMTKEDLEGKPFSPGLTLIKTEGHHDKT